MKHVLLAAQEAGGAACPLAMTVITSAPPRISERFTNGHRRTMTMFNAEQVEQLLRPINPRRVQKDNHGMSHLAAYDVSAHLTRIFGFGGWEKHILSLDLVAEDAVRDDARGRLGWFVTYRCTMRLTVKGDEWWQNEDGATGSAVNLPDRGDAHDFAMKNAISYALKRCAKDLGDQFGLSLYNKGSTAALIGRTLAGSDSQVRAGSMEPGWAGSGEAYAARHPVDADVPELAPDWDEQPPERVPRGLRACREAAGFTQEELAARLGVAGGSVSKWETGRNPMGTDDLQRVAEILGVAPAALLPTNRDGSLSRSQTTDAEKDAAGVMTSAQQAEHTALQPKRGESARVYRETPTHDNLGDSGSVSRESPVDNPPDIWTGQPAGQLPNDPYAENPEGRPGSISRDQSAAMHAAFKELGITERGPRLAVTRRLLGLGPELTTSKHLSWQQAAALLVALEEKARTGA